MKVKLDAQLADHGSIWTVRPLTTAAKEWIEENITGETNWFGGALAVEARFMQELVEGMQADGLEVGI